MLYIVLYTNPEHQDGFTTVLTYRYYTSAKAARKAVRKHYKMQFGLTSLKWRLNKTLAYAGTGFRYSILKDIDSVFWEIVELTPAS